MTLSQLLASVGVMTILYTVFVQGSHLNLTYVFGENRLYPGNEKKFSSEGSVRNSRISGLGTLVSLTTPSVLFPG